MQTNSGHRRGYSLEKITSSDVPSCSKKRFQKLRPHNSCRTFLSKWCSQLIYFESRWCVHRIVAWHIFPIEVQMWQIAFYPIGSLFQRMQRQCTISGYRPYVQCAKGGVNPHFWHQLLQLKILPIVWFQGIFRWFLPSNVGPSSSTYL